MMLAAVLAWAWPALEGDAERAVMPLAATPWQTWSPVAVASARKEGRPVFVDFTAAWCVTCQLNKRTTLADAQLLEEFAGKRVLLLRADWTRRDPVIAQELVQLGRSGVPVYAVYGPGADKPQLLSEVLTVAQVRAALNKF